MIWVSFIKRFSLTSAIKQI